jgi:hypothetical protein
VYPRAPAHHQIISRCTAIPRPTYLSHIIESGAHCPSDHHVKLNTSACMSGLYHADMVPGVTSAFSGALTTLRLLRIFRLARFWHSLSRIIAIVLSSFASVAYLTLLLLLFIFIAALMGLQVGWRQGGDALPEHVASACLVHQTACRLLAADWVCTCCVGCCPTRSACLLLCHGQAQVESEQCLPYRKSDPYRVNICFMWSN